MSSRLFVMRKLDQMWQTSYNKIRLICEKCELSAFA